MVSWHNIFFNLQIYKKFFQLKNLFLVQSGYLPDDGFGIVFFHLLTACRHKGLLQ